MEQAIQKQADEAEADNYLFAPDVECDADLLWNHVSYVHSSVDGLIDKWFGKELEYTTTEEDIVNIHTILKGNEYAEGPLDSKARNIQYKIIQELCLELHTDLTEGMPKKFIYNNSEMLHKYLLEVFEQYNQDNDLDENGSSIKPTPDEASTAS